MFRPSIKSLPTLVVLAVVALTLYYVSETRLVEVKVPYYQTKLSAAKEMRTAMEVIRDYRAAKGVFTEVVGDPLAITLIGEKYSQVTTEEGLLSSKMTALNPNFAAVIVDMLKQAKVEKEDKIAVAVTGSFPGLNIALFSACKALGVVPVVITSLGSSSWGANEEDFTWLDIEKVLLDKGVFDYKSSAVSLGGGGDKGFGLSQMGQQLLRDSAQRNHIPLIEEQDLSSNVIRRMKIYGDIRQYKAFVNIGGGVAALGHPTNGDLIAPGFSHRLTPMNYPALGVIHYFGYEIPVIHLLNVDVICAEYDLPMAPNPLPPVGKGKVFLEKRYDWKIVAGSLVVIALMLALVFRLDRKVFKFAEQGQEPDLLL